MRPAFGRRPAGYYNVTASVTGYGALDSTTFAATTSEASQAFALAATATLILNVNETGALGGTLITSGTFIRCIQDGLTEYGTAKNVSGTGVCVFDYVPFGDSETPYSFYIKQLTSDTTHNKHTGVITIEMAGATQLEYVQNSCRTVVYFRGCKLQRPDPQRYADFYRPAIMPLPIT